MKTITAADLFCGMGGTSFGLYEAADDLGLSVDLLAVNHWKVAIETHTQNHKLARHLCETLDGVNPRKVVPSGRLRLLVASPECTHHSTARGGRPMSDQSRASAWHVVRWAEALRIDDILIENVKEFLSWGPIGANGRPLKSQKGKTFEALVMALESLNYRVEWKILCAADYGDPTTRERLFVRARLGRKAIKWPEPSHAKVVGNDLFASLKPWRAAREVIEWSLQGQSIFNRARPLSPNTMRRIAAGMMKLNGIDISPIIVKLYGTSTAQSVDKPMPTVTATGQHLALAQPFVLGQQSGGAPRDTKEPLPTVSTDGAIGLTQPFLLPKEGIYKGNAARPIGQPAPTVIGDGRLHLTEPFLTEFHGEREGQAPRHRSIDKPLQTVASNPIGLTEPFIAEFHSTTPNGKERTRELKEPLPTVDCANRFGFVEPFLVGAGGPTGQGRHPEDLSKPMGTVLGENHRAVVEPMLLSAGGPEVAARPVSEPVNTVLTRDHMGMAEPIIVESAHTGDKRGRTHDLKDPLKTVTGSPNFGLAQAYLVQYNGTADSQSVEKPLGAVTTKPRFALVEIKGKLYELDIRFRMLTPRELARAQGFPDSFEITGTKADQVKQIGNAVPGGLAKALCMAALS